MIQKYQMTVLCIDQTEVNRPNIRCKFFRICGFLVDILLYWQVNCITENSMQIISPGFTHIK